MKGYPTFLLLNIHHHMVSYTELKKSHQTAIRIVFWFLARWAHTISKINPLHVRALAKRISQYQNCSCPFETTKNTTKETRASVSNDIISFPDRELLIRTYRPVTNETLPIIIYYHGGGWMLGTLNDFDEICSELADLSEAVVVSVAYRLAPEFQFPAAALDACDALTWVTEHADQFGGDPSRIFVAGDSAGGGLAVVAALKARESSGPNLKGQLLFYPATNPANWHNIEIDFMEIDQLFLVKYLVWIRETYAPDPADWRDERLSPLLASDVTGLPPTLLITADFDPLKREGLEYGDRLSISGIPVDVHSIPAYHGFLNMSRPEPRNRALSLAGRFVKQSTC